MLKLDGYKINSLIYESSNTSVYRALREKDKNPVVLKLLKKEYPTPEQIKQFRYEYDIAKDLNINGVIKNHDIINYKNTMAIIMEDIGGDSLDKIINISKLKIKPFLTICIKICEILDQVHKKNLIHKDIKPHNVIINAKTGEIKLIDFSISTKLKKKNQSLVNPEQLEGTLAYISPEQTGRMNRSIDYRSDFYSLGIMFYEMITGKRPFESKDPMELVHYHIALLPPAPHEVDNTIPKVISDIIMKLMSKTAEERYQSTYGILTDLRKCYSQLKEKGKISDFEIAKSDISESFHIPEKLYGRENEIKLLMEIFNKVSKGSKELLFFKGAPGIGKSALINEIHKPIVEKHGFFISGKHDKFKKNIPYTAIIEAFQNIVQQIISENEEKLAYWKNKILKATGSIGQVIIDVIPEVELIIGKQPEVPELPAQEAQNRFNMVFQNFIKVFSDEKHPLVLFLDDLQWADNASMQLLKVLLSDSQLKFFLFIGSFRDMNEDISQILLMLDELKKDGLTWQEIKLTPIKDDAVNNMISETVNAAPAKTKDITKIIISKTGGNPFFIIEFLKTLNEDGLIYFEKGWIWDIKKIKNANVTDNVVDLMADKIKKLDENTWNIMKIAACIGVNFTLKTLAEISEKSEDEIFKDLVPAFNEGMILMVDKNVKFTHDRVREAAYSIISKKEQKELHYKIGQTILKSMKEYQQDDRIFNAANQLNLAKDILNKNERKQLIEINLQAGLKAKASAAFEAALGFFKEGMELLPDNSWKNNYEITLNLYTERAEAEYLISRFNEADKFFNLVLKNAKDIFDKIKIYDLKITQYTTQQKLKEAISIGRKALRILGVKLPRNPNQFSVIIEILKVKSKIGKIDIRKLYNMSEMKNPRIIAAISILVSLIVPSYVASPNLFTILNLRGALLSLKYGSTPGAAFGFITYGMVLSVVFKDVKNGYKIGVFAKDLIEKYHAQYLKSKIIFSFNSFIAHWQDHPQKFLNDYKKAFDIGIMHGEKQYSIYGLNFYYSQYSFFIGKNLNNMMNEMESFLKILKKSDFEDVLMYFSIVKEVVSNLLISDINIIKNKKEFTLLKGKDFDETISLSYLEKTGARMGIYWFYAVKSFFMYLFNYYDDAYSLINNSVKYEDAVFGQTFVPLTRLIFCLTLTSKYEKCSNNIKKQYLKKIIKIEKEYKVWADNGKDNYYHKYLLIQAEKAKILGTDNKAMKLYDEAIKEAKINKYINIEAIANECASKFYQSRKMEKIANLYIKEAHYCYSQWGAIAKVIQLEKKHPNLLEKIKESNGYDMASTISETLISSSSSSSSSSSASGSTTSKFLDINTIMKATQAISGEIEMESLLSKMIKILIENAGAQKGILILNQDNNYFIQAEADISKNKLELLKSIPLDKAKNLSPAIIRYVIKKGETIILDNAAKEGMFEKDQYIMKNKPKSVLCSTIVNKGKLIGILYLENNLSTGTFTPARVEMLKILSSQAAISIENANLIENMKDTERLKNEMEIAERIQTSLVPPAPDHPELDIAAKMQPAEEVGGDYYDILFDKNKDLWVAIGDVSGHGVTPGLIMMMAETSFSTDIIEADGNHTPKDAIITVNRILTKNIRDRLKEKHFMTMSFLKYQGNGKFLHSGAHVDIIIYRAKTKKCEIIKTDGLYLGIKSDISKVTENHKFELNINDVLVLYTDGVIESRHKDDKRLMGQEILQEIIIKNGDKNSTTIMNEIVNKALSWCDNKPEDDITVVALKRKKKEQ